MSMSENPRKTVNPNTAPDPLEGKSEEELKQIIRDLEKSHGVDIQKMNQYAVIIQTIAGQIKEIGLNAQIVGKNAEQNLDQIMRNGPIRARNPQNPS